jgi:uncharacterized protein YjiS (DUF1127 family)
MQTEHNNLPSLCLLRRDRIPILCIATTVPVKRSAYLQVLSMFVTHILSQVRAYLRYRETLRELSHLSDRELNDLGLSRFEIAAVAQQAAAA